ncbi:hypothetical protein [Yoonia sp. SS1-5]|uniref:Uncharacterized protein n=1 Tax=Yoonia rhodophyticola TaxID=3137370 RepID=A0AAN0NKN8_9RHOB
MALVAIIFGSLVALIGAMLSIIVSGEPFRMILEMYVSTGFAIMAMIYLSSFVPAIRDGNANLFK